MAGHVDKDLVCCVGFPAANLQLNLYDACLIVVVVCIAES